MQLIKDQQIIENTWQYIADNDELKTGDISVSVARWQADKQQLIAHDGKLGIRMSTTDSADELANDLEKFQLIELDFPDFCRRTFVFSGLVVERALSLSRRNKSHRTLHS